ncbi:Uncharacterised protein [Mycobacteroides abscessus subsp. abscessus]|nr:Uncharacterised protein [Mycobacteroides abscessus subsp. abscessus]
MSMQQADRFFGVWLGGIEKTQKACHDHMLLIISRVNALFMDIRTIGNHNHAHALPTHHGIGLLKLTFAFVS